MREIKFRAWEKDFERMNHRVIMGNTDESDDYYTASLIWSDIDIDWKYFDSFSNITVMQYTGLKDRNDVPIYEGDIIRWESKITKKENWFGKVERLGAEFVVWTSQNARNSGGWLNVAHSKVEVVGNVYEHPYLWEEVDNA